MNRAVFFDRDGTLNHDGGYTYKTEDYILLPGVAETLKLLKEKFVFFIVTNQSGIGRGYFSLEDVHKFNDTMINDLKEEGIEFKKIFICPHGPEDGCDCRKPSTKSLLEAAKEFDIDLSKSFVVGDHPCDVEMGQKAGCKSVYLLTGHGKKHRDEMDKTDYIANNMVEAGEWILKQDD
tara:strand:- start:778 stop:1311 length:534 start_codon:yes stop_codon:yes gene_type:complete